MKVDLGKLIQKILKAIMPTYKDMITLLITIIAEVHNEGLTDDAARKEVQRRFRAQWKGVIRDSLLNWLIETLVLNTKF